jgi:superfamily II DNA or RNA helicase
VTRQPRPRTATDLAASGLPPAFPDRAAWGTATKLRAWQAAALEQYFATTRRDFLAVATPGAGKTSFALTLGANLLAKRMIDRVVVVAPTEHLKTQWAEAAGRVGIAIDPEFGVRQGRAAKDFAGVALTYAGVAANPLALRIRIEAFKTLVILDEIHHAGAVSVRHQPDPVRAVRADG